MGFVILLFVLLGNIWIWKIFQYSPAVTLLILVLSLYIFVAIRSKKNYLLAAVPFIFLLIILFSGGFGKPALARNDEDKLLMVQRLNEYPPITILPVAHWLEERPETIAFYKLCDNLGEVINPNLYFFANHPREEPLVREIEKFPYVLIPFFIFGAFILVDEKRLSLLTITFLLPILYYSIFGFDKSIGPILVFPFLSICIWSGLRKLKLKYFLIYLIIFVPFFVQTIIYAQH